ncbi:hypothetical protein JYU34_019193 [Plutella xylostella]|uniref:Uncharacterized protein n=1 Tax=Plutella xylostella TaxID=51655 RepID=A0ABQ7PWA3_PLUXY|nr:hypothetical protein JYU34_019193 [Plutella xylostella]
MTTCETLRNPSTISSTSTMEQFEAETVGTKRLKCIGRTFEKKSRIKRDLLEIFKVLLVILLSLNLVTIVKSGETDTDSVDSSNINKLVEKSRSYFSDVYRNGTFVTGNSLWDNILNQCSVKPTVSCLQKNVFSYLDESLNYNGDLKVANGVCFKKNKVDVGKYTKEANVIYLTGSTDDEKEEFNGRDLDEENTIDDYEEESETPLEEVTDVLYDKGVNFMLTHDMKLTLPETFFHGSTLKISPRALTKTGALVHIELEPKVQENGEGRIFFKKIKKYIRKKLVMAAIAIILVVKLIALKLIFVLPVIFGVTTAKKIFLKLLLFLFPALSHIFKLCSWYHQNYHTTKFHHHHHLITHHHHKPPHHGHPAPVYGPPSHHNSVQVHQPTHHSGPTFEHYNQDWELSGPGLGSEYIGSDINRNAIANFKPNVNDVNDINAWGLGLPPGTSMNVGEIASSSNNQASVVQPNGGGRPIYNNGRPSGPQAKNPYNRNKPVQPNDPEKEALIRAAALAARAPPSPVRDEVLRVSTAKLHETNRIQTEAKLIRTQKEILAKQDPDTIAADKFYSPLLDRVDGILAPLGAADVGCRERAVCSLYREPFSHAPYSNLLSNELSKDSNELVPPAESKIAILYYRYVQAARDGQDQNDCLALYPHCNMDFGKKKKK